MRLRVGRFAFRTSLRKILYKVGKMLEKKATPSEKIDNEKSLFFNVVTQYLDEK